MKKFRSYIARIVTFLVALQILNMGLFVQNIEPLAFPTSSISDNNIINSVVEYVSEVVLNKVNAIPENNGRDNKDLQAHKHFTIKITEFQRSVFAMHAVISSSKNNDFQADNYCYRFYKEINPPPPGLGFFYL